MSTLTPEQAARVDIDAALEGAGWIVQDQPAMNLYAGLGVAVREFKMAKNHGRVDYLLFVDGEAVGVVEAKPAGFPISGVEPQAQKYATGLPATLDPPVRPLPFLYVSTGAVTAFTNMLDPHPRSRNVYRVARPETLKEWIDADTLDEWVTDLHKQGATHLTAADDERPSSLRSRVQILQPIEPGDAWERRLFANQVKAVNNLEESLKADRPRSLVQMATGSGKTIFAITSIYRLIKYGGARRVLFLVDRTNLGEQAETAFESYRTPDDNRKLTELFGVQRLKSNTIGDSTKVAITTIQRMYSMLRGDPELDPEHENGSAWAEDVANTLVGLPKEPMPVVYNPAYPPEYFDVIVIDECHRSIYSLWKQVLDYFDAWLIGLTATPAKNTFGFFFQNLVMEYSHEDAVADQVNVDFDIYPIRTRITEQGAVIEAQTPDTPMVGYRSRLDRKTRWAQPDEDVEYTGKDLDRSVVAEDQIRLIGRTFRDRLPVDIFPGRTKVPKTLVFAKDDSHAEDIVRIFRQVFGRGNDFCQKITYKVTGKKPKDLIDEFRSSFLPRIAVTVDMVATGTDIRPVEIVMFMRSVKSRVLYEQMKGRGVRIVSPTELKAVTPDATVKDRFVLIDCVSITDSKLDDTKPLETQPTVPFKKLLDHVGAGGVHGSVLASLASRLARLGKRCGPTEHAQIEKVSGGTPLTTICGAIVQALNPDAQIARARNDNGLGPDADPSEKQLKKAAKALAKEAVKILAANPELRQVLQTVKQQVEQIIDQTTKDELLYAGVSPEAKEKAKALVTSFRDYLEEHKDEIAALQFFYAVPHAKRLRYADIKALSESIQAPPRAWTPEKLWRAYALLEKDRVRGASGKRLLTDVVSLVRFALQEDAELVPYAAQVRARFATWMAQQSQAGRAFSDEQVQWLEMMRDHMAASWEIELDDFDLAPFAEAGGIARAVAVFGGELRGVLRELNEVLAA